MPPVFMSSRFRVAVVQAAPAFFDSERSAIEAAVLIRQAGEQGARLVLLPEAFIPAYPRGLSFGRAVGSRSTEGRRPWQRYWAEAVDVPGPGPKLLERRPARPLSSRMGVIERDCIGSRGTLYCTLLYFGPDGRLLGKHRKLKPTSSERLDLGRGGRRTLTVVRRSSAGRGPHLLGKLHAAGADGALGQGLTSTWRPPPTPATPGRPHSVTSPAKDGASSWGQSVRHTIHVPRRPSGVGDLSRPPEVLCRGGSAIVWPLGEVLAGPVFDQGTLFAELDPAEILQARLDFDVVGHYARPDVFRLTVNEAPRATVRFGTTGWID